MLDEIVVLSSLRRVRLSHREAEREEEQAVAMARAAGWSWDRIGRELSVPGETLRRHHRARHSA